MTCLLKQRNTKSLVRGGKQFAAGLSEYQQHIAGHSDIAPGRKTDPGPYFDWQYFRNSYLNLKLRHHRKN